jgi:1-phosphofructokinase
MADEPLAALRGCPAWIVKLNRRQLAAATGQAVEDAAGVVREGRKLLAVHGGAAECLIVTRGADGAVLLSGDVALSGRVGVHPGRIVSTVGSGESLLAGVLAGFLRSRSWEKALHEGLAAATANAVNWDAGRITLEELQEFREATTVEAAGPG